MLQRIIEAFQTAAAWVAVNAGLPSDWAEAATQASTWYNQNGQYKFRTGQRVRAKKPYRYYLTVKGHKNLSGDDAYLMRTPEGKTELHFKRNIEVYFEATEQHRPENVRTICPPNIKNNHL